MARSLQRFWALAKVRLASAWTTVKRAAIDADSLDDAAPSQAAAAEVLQREAALLRGGVAKLGQLRAYFDTQSGAARERLAALWDRVPGEAPERIAAVVAGELGAPPSQVFATWEDTPLGAASLGQVHAATDREGQALAVKVQYPEVQAGLRDDLSSTALLRAMAGAELGGHLDAAALAALRTSLLDELDYRREAATLATFGDAWRGDPAIVIPRVYPALSSERVLTMERLVGRALPAFVDDPNVTDAQRSRVGETIFRFAFGSPLRFGTLNGDPHPGNYLVLDADVGRVGFLDFGCTATLGPEVLTAERQFWYALVVRDGELMRHAAAQLGLVSRPTVFDGEVWREWEELLSQPFLVRTPFRLEPPRIRRLVAVTDRLLRADRIALPASVIVLWRQRLGALTVIASLRPQFEFRRRLAELVDDGHHPTPLADRYV